MDCDYHNDQQPSTSVGKTPRWSAKCSCRLSWCHCRLTNKSITDGSGSAATIRFDLIFIEKCHHCHGAAEFEFPIETKSFSCQAYEFLMPLTAAKAIGEMLAEVCLDDESREQFREAIVEYVQVEKVAERVGGRERQKPSDRRGGYGSGHDRVQRRQKRQRWRW